MISGPTREVGIPGGMRGQGSLKDHFASGEHRQLLLGGETREGDPGRDQVDHP